jgi:hypothetical protein
MDLAEEIVNLLEQWLTARQHGIVQQQNYAKIVLIELLRKALKGEK